MRQSPPSRHPAGLTLIEVLVAMMIFTVGALGLAAASATIARQMGASAQRGYAASISRLRSERFHAAPCGASGSGTEQSRGLRSEWSVDRNTISAELDNRVTRSTALGMRADRFMSGIPCD
ncbi:MAG: prepilin-type N-terminal cleavage/methylation domain-containing protein [Gemmatimonadaceae bacterium]